MVSKVSALLNNETVINNQREHDVLVNLFIGWSEQNFSGNSFIALASITILVLALLSGLFMFFMRQTIIVMSRHIEYDQKNEIFKHYQQLDANFYKTHNTGDLMNRISEDVSRVRMYTGPAVMYLTNLVIRISLCTYFMVLKDPKLTLYVLAPLPLLAIVIYFVNSIINKKSERIQALLSDLTTNAQQSYSGIRVIKSYVQEKAMIRFFNKNTDDYKDNAVGLAKVEAIYFPSMALMIGLSTLITVMVGGLQVLDGTLSVGVIVEFVIYINMLTFPVSAIGWVASMIQRAAASQKRINEFMQTDPVIKDNHSNAKIDLGGNIAFKAVDFVYPHTGIRALKHFNFTINKGDKVMILGKTGSGKSTIAQLLLRFYDITEGSVTINGHSINEIPLKQLRENIAYVPQDVFLFSDTITNNINFGMSDKGDVLNTERAAQFSSIHKEIQSFTEGYDTMVGERGVTLSGGQKQRISIARALMKDADIVIFDDCLSAVDAKTEHEISANLKEYLEQKTAIIITHRIISSIHFDKIIVMQNGKIAEEGTHHELLTRQGLYAEILRMQSAGYDTDNMANN